MKDQLTTIREALKPLTNNSGVRKAFAALAQLEAMVGEQEPVAEWVKSPVGEFPQLVWEPGHVAKIGDKLYAGADPVAQQPLPCDSPCGNVKCAVGCKNHVAQQPQAEAVPVVDRVYEAAKRLVDHADFQLGGVLSAKSKARDIPSNAASKVKARHLASLRDALAKTPQQAEAVQYTRADLDRAYSAGLVEGERLAIQQAEAGPIGFKHACYLWVDPETNNYEVDHFEHHLSELTPAYIKVAAIAQQKGGV